ncbi:hypothetical protein GCM10018953_75780 [Streptosporangium nondiastaticum]|uniref:hypothetical protein n=1 Tax=Streptosporangium nondiastaticum TaxID=35764 RepID=UPI0031F8EDC8
MFTNFKIDQAATFQGVAFLACEPKTKFNPIKGAPREQEALQDGTPKWEVQVAAIFKSQFRGVQSEVLKIGVASHRNPGEGLMPYTPIHLVDFEVGVMEKTKKNPETGEERVIGLQVWYRAAEIRPLTATGSKTRAAAETAAA